MKGKNLHVKTNAPNEETNVWNRALDPRFDQMKNDAIENLCLADHCIQIHTYTVTKANANANAMLQFIPYALHTRNSLSLSP